MIQTNPKQMPHDEVMEQSLIGTLIKFGNLFGSVASRLKPGYFFNKKCEQIFRAMDGVVIDYLQQMSKADGGRELNEARLLGDIAHALQKLAVELNLPIVILSQLNRNSTTTGDGTPRLSDLRGSGAIEEAADNVFLLHRPESEGRGYSGRYSDIDPHNTALLICAKSRNGESGRNYFLAFNPALTTFSPLPTPPHLSSMPIGAKPSGSMPSTSMPTSAKPSGDEFGGLFC